jgi:hypothetical protein
MVLADVGAEPLMRVRRAFQTIFPAGTMRFVWRDASHCYTFQSIDQAKRWSNARLGLDGKRLADPKPLDAALEDVAMLLLFGASATEPSIPEELLSKCGIGGMIGRKAELDQFVRQRYIWVSRITGGATANNMGQLCQTFVKERLAALLPDWTFSRTTIPGISQNRGATDMSFDIVAKSRDTVCCAIEVSFQVTTNSTIERKAGQAQDRQRVLHRKGHRIAYVIDGAGNFERKSALRTICRHSDCTVALSDAELATLAKYLKSIEKP